MSRNPPLLAILFLSFLLVAVVPLVSLGIALGQIISGSLEASMVSGSSRLIMSVTEQVSRYLDDARFQLQEIDRVGFSSGFVAEDLRTSFLEDHIRTASPFTRILILDGSGRVTHAVPSDSDIIGSDFSSQRYFGRISSKQTVYWSGTFLDMKTGDVTLSLSYYGEGGRLFVGYLDLEVLNRIVDRLSADNGSYVMILDERNTVIAHPDRGWVASRTNMSNLRVEPLDIAGGETFTDVFWIKSPGVVAGYQMLSGLEWKIAIVHSASIFWKPLRRTRFLIFIGVFLALIFAFVLAVLCFRSVYRPLRQLSEVTNSVADGRYDVESRITGCREIHSLAVQVFHMAASVESREWAMLKNDQRLTALVRLGEMKQASLEEMVRFVTDQALVLTDSSVAYLLFLSQGYKQLTLLKDADMSDPVTGPELLRSLERSSIWVPAVAERSAVIDNGLRSLDLPGPPPYRALFIRHLAVPIFHNGEVVAVMGVGNKSGTYNHTDIRQITLLLDGLMSNVSHRLHQDALERMNYELENRVRQRTMDLRHSLQQLTETQEQLVENEKMAALGGLVAGVAHEINTPVGVGVTAVSHLDLVTREMEQRLKSEADVPAFWLRYIGVAKTSCEIIYRNLRRASELIASFKQVAVDQTSEAVRTFFVRSYIEEILVSLQPRLKTRDPQVEVVCDPLLEIESYPGAYSQILTNLILNTLIHGYPEDGSVKIRIVVSVEEEVLKLEYRDFGEGIEKESLPKIFLPFFTTRRGTGGSGLGLPIVFNVVTNTLGGRINCTSTRGDGVLFTISCPLNLVAPAELTPV